ncbi:MAG: Fe-S cluster assembly ATPase SufC [Pseudomonadota bacterium]|nr:Fe-S cluster assembly ATPase SufC [Pseudomonadota bacterium]
MLEIKNLHVSIDGNEILRGINLKIEAGKTYAIMGPNGSGKSTLSYVLAGSDKYKITNGTVSFNGKDLLEMDPEQRAGEGLFLGFQYPVEIPGVATSTFLKTALNAVRKYRGEDELDAMQFLKLVRKKAEEIAMSDEMLKRPVNVGFSGGEKKRNEVLQLAMLEPKLAVLDETDSGLDIDALRTVADGVNRLRNPKRSMLVITHYQRLLNYIVPDVIHVLVNGRIVATGAKDLAIELEKSGYSMFTDNQAA